MVWRKIMKACPYCVRNNNHFLQVLDSESSSWYCQFSPSWVVFARYLFAECTDPVWTLALPAISCVTLGKPITSLKASFFSHNTEMRPSPQKNDRVYKVKVKQFKMLCELYAVIQTSIISYCYCVAKTRQIFGQNVPSDKRGTEKQRQ